jgi:phosphate starvation-inducible PhoH-like protein
MKYYIIACFGIFFKDSLAFSANGFKSTLKSLQLTPNQQIYYDYLQDDDAPIVICHGSSGSGKTMIPIIHALDQLKKKKYDKIIITRPSVLVDADNFGALPGNINDKIFPLIRHIGEIIGDEPKQTTNLYNIVKENKIEVIPLEYIRGYSFKNCFILADEMQNATKGQMKALLTRISDNSKMVITGDYEQSDLNCENGLYHFLLRYNSYIQFISNPQFVKSIQMTREDIMRSDIVKEVLSIYDYI